MNSKLKKNTALLLISNINRTSNKRRPVSDSFHETVQTKDFTYMLLNVFVHFISFIMFYNRYLKIRLCTTQTPHRMPKIILFFDYLLSVNSANHQVSDSPLQRFFYKILKVPAFQQCMFYYFKTQTILIYYSCYI